MGLVVIITQYKGNIMVDQDSKHWHLDKKVPISLLFAILIQTSGAFWWASGVEKSIQRLEKDSDATHLLSERVIRLEVQMQQTNSLLSEIRDELRRQK